MHILFLTDNFPPEVNAPASRTFEVAMSSPTSIRLMKGRSRGIWAGLMSARVGSIPPPARDSQ